MRLQKQKNSCSYLLCILALLCIFPASLPAREDERFLFIVSEIEKNSFVNGAKSYKLLEELYEIAGENPDNLDFAAQTLYMESLVNAAQGRNDSTINERITNVLQMTDKKERPFEYALLQYSLCLNNNIKSAYADAFAAGLHALEQFQALKDSLFIGKTFVELGVICSHIKSYKMSEEYFQETLSFVPKNSEEYFRAKRGLASILYFTNERERSVDSLWQIIPYMEEMRDTALLMATYMGLAVSYSALKEHEKAAQCYSILLNLIKFIDNSRTTIILYNNLGVYYYNKREWDKALHYFDTTKTASFQAKNYVSLSSAFFALSHIYAQLENIDSAYFYLTEYNKLNNQIVNNAKTIEAYQAYVSVLLESSQKELTIAEQEIQLKNRRFSLMIILIIAIVGIAASVFIIFQQKKRQQALLKEAENKDLAERLKNEQKIQQLQQEQLESKVREITSYSLLLAGKNNILKQIASLTEQPNINQNKINDQINAIIKSNMTVEHDWESFMIHFDKVHPSFFDKLKTYCSDLTKNNLHLCAYIRIGLSTKEIAQILNISAETSRTNRYRLKKKLKLEEEDSLDDFLRNL